MRKIIGIIGLLIIAAVFVAMGRAANSEDKSNALALQGKWKGHEIGNDGNNACSLNVDGKNIEYKGTEPNDWVKGAFTMKENTNPQQLDITITACESPENIGKICHAIYEIKAATLTISGNAPGDTNVPASFDAPEARKFVFTKE